MSEAGDVEELAAAVERLDLGCFNWVFADADGNIAYRSPCQLPVRPGWRGTFPVPGWLRRYEWQGFVPKAELPASTNPARGWLATANNQVVPSDRFFTAYNNDASTPNRFLRIVERIGSESERGGLTVASSAAIQLDTRYQMWAGLREQLSGNFCEISGAGTSPRIEQARRHLCDWDGTMGEDSIAATLFVLWTNAVLDRALADEFPGRSESDVWRYVQSLLQFEATYTGSGRGPSGRRCGTT
jgi:penicillin amidase